MLFDWFGFLGVVLSLQYSNCVLVTELCNRMWLRLSEFLLMFW